MEKNQKMNIMHMPDIDKGWLAGNSRLKIEYPPLGLYDCAMIRARQRSPEIPGQVG